MPSTQVTSLRMEQKFKKTPVGEIPLNWELSSLSDISTIIMGQSPPSSDCNHDGIGLPFYQGNADFGTIYPTPTYWCNAPKKTAKAGDILISVRAPVGAINISPHECCIGRGLSAVRAEDVDQTYLYFALLFSSMQLNNLAQGSTFEAINSKELLNLPITVPSKTEQKRIAEILSSLDELIEKTDSVIQKTKKLKKGLMQQLLTRGIGHTKFKTSPLGEILVDWELKKLRDIGEFRNGKAHEKIIDESGKYIVVNSKFISSESKESKRCKQCLSPVSVNDIAMVMSDVPNGKALAKCFLVKENDKYTLNQRICSIKPFRANANYLFYCLNRNEYFLGFDSGVDQTNLRKEDILECPVFEPPPPEQKKIAEILSSADDEISKEETYKQNLGQTKKALMQVLLTGKVRVV